MKRLLLLCLTAAAWPGLALGQCNPSLPGSCAPNDPVLFGIQQQQQNSNMQRREIDMQNQKLQQIERQNTQRYQNQPQPSVSTSRSTNFSVPQIIEPDNAPRRARSKVSRRRAPAVHMQQRRRK
jgi:hypothetical protein